MFYVFEVEVTCLYGLLLTPSTQGSCAIDCRRTAGCSGFTYDKTNNVCTLGGMEGQEFRDCYGTLDFSNEVGR